MRIDDGARHVITHTNAFNEETYGPVMSNTGTQTDREYDGQPNATATGDDNTAFADEDGIVILDPLGRETTELIPGAWQQVVVTVDVSAFVGNYLYCWIDLNGDGDWDDSGIDTASGGSLTWSESFVSPIHFGATQTLDFYVPHTGIDPGQVNARFRLIAVEEQQARWVQDPSWSLGYSGIAYTGEVEDYQYTLVSVDYGDAPVDETMLLDDGARHVLDHGPWLAATTDGVRTDREYDGQPNADATGDDTDNNGTGMVDEAELYGTYTAVGITSIPFLLTGIANDFAVTYEDAPGDFQVVFEPVPVSTPVNASWDETTATLTVQLQADMTANAILNVINNPAVGSPLTASLLPESSANDEDGVVLLDVLGNATTGLIPGELATVRVTLDLASPEKRSPLRVDRLQRATGDWDDSGSDGVSSWNEQIADNYVLRVNDTDGDGVPENVATISFYVPHLDIDPGTVYARFRVIGDEEYAYRTGVNSNWTLDTTGLAYSGEVEDYAYVILNVDYGDASSAPTMRADDGARHVLDVGPWMSTTGTLPDSEVDGQPDGTATGDNLAGANDEDGVTLLDWKGDKTTELVPGEWATIQVTVDASSPQAGYLYAWIDFTGDGVWGDSDDTDPVGAWDEQIAEALLITPGETAEITFFVPYAGIDPGMVDARFRLIGASEYTIRTAAPNEDWTLPIDTIAYSGEVEDYQYEILPLDYGDSDLPHTLRVDNGARHVITGPTLATAPDWEYDGQPTADATGDDVTGGDEDGVILLDWLGQTTTQLVPGELATVVVTVDPSATENGYLYAWIDFNGDGDWDDSGILTQLRIATAWDEQIADGVLIAPGSPAGIEFLVPNDIDPGMIQARFRLIGEEEYLARDLATPGWTLGYDGVAYSGEVEDYQFEVLPVDYGDMADSHTLWEDDGARHVIRGPFLAGIPDHDGDGQPTAGALGDDLDNDGSHILTSDDLLIGTTYLTSGGIPGLRASTITIDPDGVDNTFQVLDPSGTNDIGLVFEVGVPGEDSTGVWSGATQTLTVTFDDGVTTIYDLVATINNTLLSPLVATMVDDEEGVVLYNNAGQATTKIIPGEWAWVDVTVDPAATEMGYLYAWINYDGDDVWGASGTETQAGVTYAWDEQIAEHLAVNPGETVTIPFFVPHDVDAGVVSARFRLINQAEYDSRTAIDASWTLPVDGIAYSGEVEDYEFEVLGFDYGDADVASTIWGNDGARHVFDASVAGPAFQWTSSVAVDVEGDGQRSIGADADDLTGADDEDGVFFWQLLMPGETATIGVSVADSGGWLDGWIDWNQNGVFDTDEYLFGNQGYRNVFVLPGFTSIPITVPEDAVVGETYARFRVSTQGRLAPDGLAFDGEVEDYLWTIQSMDFGDARHTYGTTRADDGARHVITGPLLGDADHDIDGFPSPDALGDDTELDTDPGDDENGVSLTTLLIPGEQAQVVVDVVGSGYLDAWFDFNDDGNWGQYVNGTWVDDANEHVFGGQVWVSGTTLLTLDVPQDAEPGQIFARFRITANGLDSNGQALTPHGLAYSGEVEDYLYHVEEIDYGDAANNGDDLTAPSFPVTRAQDGARHVIAPTGPHLGSLVDHDTDGVPSTGADADDVLDGNDDEDGVSFSSLFWVGNTDPALDPEYNITVNTGDANAYVDLWIDFNGDGDWDDADEHVLDVEVAQSATAVVLNDTFSIPDPDPANRYTGYSYARVRVSSTDLDLPYGLAYDGEVEDYQIYLDAAPVADAGGPYWINTDEDLWLDGSGSSDVDIPADSIVEYQWDFSYDPTLPYDPTDERTYFNPEFVTDQAIDVIEWPWSDIIQVPQPRPEGALPIYLRVVDSFGAYSAVVDGDGNVVDGAEADLYIFDNEVHASFEVTDEYGAALTEYEPEQTILFDNQSWHDRGADLGFDKYLVTYEWDFEYDGTFTADKTLTAVNADGSLDMTKLNDPTFGDTSYSYGAFGEYTAVLRVTDSNDPAKTAMTSVVVSVTAGNYNPLADTGGTYTIDVGDSVTMTGVASLYDDPALGTNPASWGDSVVDWQWDINNDGTYDVSGQQVTLTWSQLVTLGIDIPSANDGYAVSDVRLRVEDSLGASDTVVTQLYVHENQPHAMADASATVIAPDTEVTFDGTMSWHDRDPADVTDHTWDPTDDRAIVRYEWDFDGDGAFDLVQNDPTAADFGVASYTYTQFGIYNANLRVTDNNSPARRDYLDETIEIVVNQGDVIPVADPGGPYRVVVGNDLVLDAGGSYDANESAGDGITTYVWTLEADGGDVVFTTTSPTYTLAWDELSLLNLDQDYTLRLRVEDTEIAGVTTADSSLEISTTLSVHEILLTADLRTSDDVYYVSPDASVTFDATASANSHPDHEVVKFEWDLDGDGIYETTQDDPGAADFGLLTHTFGQYGTYTVSVRATDDLDVTDIAQVEMQVLEGAIDPTAHAGGESLVNLQKAYYLDSGQALTLDASLSNVGADAAYGDSILSYAWDLDGDGQYDDASGETPVVSWAELVALGVDDTNVAYAIGLKVTDEFGVTGEATDTSLLVIFDNVPTAAINMDDADGIVGRTTEVDFYGIDSAYGTGSTAGRPDREIVMYEWDFNGDGIFEVIQNDPSASDFGMVENVTFPLFQVYTVSLRVTDSNVPAKTDTVTIDISVSEGNHDPVADISAPEMIEAGQGITLDGSASFDPDEAYGDAIVAYAWTVGGIDPLVNTATPTFTADDLAGLGLATDGTPIEVTLTVTDRLGNQDTATTSFRIYENEPIAEFTATPNPTAPGADVSFDGSASENPHPDHSIVRYQWDFNYEEGKFDTDAEGVDPTYAFGQFGDFDVALLVTDDAGQTAMSVLTVQVSSGNHAPVADAGGPYVFDAESAIVLSASGSYDDDAIYGDSIVEYRWDLDGDGEYDDAGGVTVTLPAGSFDEDTPMPIGLQVVDSMGLTGEDSTTVTVVTNVAPSADAGGPYTTTEGETIMLDGSGSMDDMGIVAYEWDFDYDGVTFNVDATGEQPSMTFTDDIATRTIALRVTDEGSLWNIGTTTLTVLNADPAAGDLAASPVATIDGQQVIGVGGTITVSGTFTDAGTDDTHTVSIAWGDGTSSDATVDQEAGTYEATHSFTAAGQFNVVATVLDDDAGSDEAATTVNVVNDLGTVDFNNDMADLDLSAGDLWFKLTAANDALLTVELGGVGGASAAATLYDASGNALTALVDGPSAGADYAVDAGASFFLRLSGDAADVDLRLTNLVSVDGAAVTVVGTDDDDAFEFELADSYLVRINDTEYHFEDAEGVVETITFAGGDGTDSATFYGSVANESARFFTGSGEFYSGVETYDEIGFFVDADAEDLIAYSGGGLDFIKMYDSPGDDTFTSRPEVTTLVGPGYSHTAYAFFSALGYATNGAGGSGGQDQAIMSDSAGKDKFELDWTGDDTFFGKLYGGTYYTRAKNFETIDASSSGGDDLAVAYGSSGDDDFFLTDGVGRVNNDFVDLEFLGFSTVIAKAGDGYDIVHIEDTDGDDELRGRSHKTTMIGSGYSITARYFDEVYAEANSGGYDKAKFHDTAGDDILHAREIDGETWAQLAVNGTTEDMLYEALGFEFVRAYHTDGNDTVDRTEAFDWLYLDGDWTDE